MIAAIAAFLMRAAETVAPPARSDWARAMRGEFDALASGPAALAWAAGCLVTAAGWQLRANLIYIAAVALLMSVKWHALAMPVFAPTTLHGMAWVERAALVGQLCLAVPIFALAVVWPHRAWLSALAVLAASPSTLFALKLFWIGFSRATPAAMNHPHLPGQILAVYSLWLEIILPAGAALILGWALGRLIRKARPGHQAA